MTDFPTHAIDAPPFFHALTLCAIGAILGSFLQAALDRRRIRKKQFHLDGGDKFAQRLKKLSKFGLRLNADLQKDINKTLKLFNYLKN